MPVSEGGLAPDFELKDENGEPHRLSDYQGRAVVLYFYPKDDTPGCTKEACNFRDDYSAYEKAGVTILGVSPDTSKSHRKFIDKYELPFTLLADTEKKVSKMYDVWGTKKFRGREYEGVRRTTFLIDAEGKIAKIYKNVKPADHSEEVLGAVEGL